MDNSTMPQLPSPRLAAPAEALVDGKELADLLGTEQPASTPPLETTKHDADEPTSNADGDLSAANEESSKLFVTPEPEDHPLEQQQLTQTDHLSPPDGQPADDIFTVQVADRQDQTNQQLPSPKMSQRGGVKALSPKIEVEVDANERKLTKSSDSELVPSKLEPTTKAESIKEEEASANIKTESVRLVKRPRPATAIPVASSRAAMGRKRQRNDDIIEGYDDAAEKNDSELAVDKPCYGEAEYYLTEAVSMVLNEVVRLAREGYCEDEVINIARTLRDNISASTRNIATWTVGFLGDTASGKSSLINSLLNLDNLATEAEDGLSGTHVIHEFAMAEPTQKTKYMAKVSYQPNNRILALIKEHFADIYNFHNMDKTTAGDVDLAEEASMKYETALDFFTNLLVGQVPNVLNDFRFPDADSATAWLKSAKSAEDKPKIETLRKCVNAYLDGFGRETGETVIGSNDMNDLAAKKKVFAGPVAGGSSPWPLVRKITIHVNARILSDGLVLVDLPGLADTNLTRVKATKEYIKNCYTIVIVHPMPRILTAVAVEKNIRECHRSGKLKNTVIACTKTDGFNHTRDRELSKADQDFIDDLKHKANVLKDEIEKLEDDRDSAEEEGDFKTYLELKTQVKQLQKQLSDAVAAVREGNIAIRNRIVMTQLQDKVMGWTGGSRSDVPIDVFCISNVVYQMHRKGYARSNPPELSADGTGVPGLREYLYVAPAREKMLKLKGCVNKLRTCLNALDSQCSKSRLERKQDVMPRIELPARKFSSKAREAGEALKGEFAQILQGCHDTHRGEWKKKAGLVLRRWLGCRWGRFLSFCRKRGVWRMENNGEYIDWNEEAAEVAATDLLAAFGRAKKAFRTIASQLTEEIESHLLDMSTALTESDELMGMDMGAVLESIEFMREDCRRQVQNVFRKLEANMDPIVHAATSGDNDESYILSAMAEAYAEAEEKSGKGSHDVRKGIIRAKMTGQEDVFNLTVGQTIDAFEDMIDREWPGDAEKRLGEAFKTVIANFNRRFDNEEEEDEKRKEFRLRLLKVVKEAKAVADTDLKKKILECDQYR